METVPTGKNDVPVTPLVIKDCGLIDVNEYVAKQNEAKKKQEEEAKKMEDERTRKRKGTSFKPKVVMTPPAEGQEK